MPPRIALSQSIGGFHQAMLGSGDFPVHRFPDDNSSYMLADDAGVVSELSPIVVVSLYIRRDNNTTGTLFRSDNAISFAGPEVGFELVGGNFRIWGGSYNAHFTSTSDTDGGWDHYLFIHDSTEQVCVGYKNGASHATTPKSGIAWAAGVPTTIRYHQYGGRGNDATIVQGTEIQQFACWALTESSVTAGLRTGDADTIAKFFKDVNDPVNFGTNAAGPTGVPALIYTNTTPTAINHGEMGGVIENWEWTGRGVDPSKADTDAVAWFPVELVDDFNTGWTATYDDGTPAVDNTWLDDTHTDKPRLTANPVHRIATDNPGDTLTLSKDITITPDTLTAVQDKYKPIHLMIQSSGGGTSAQQTIRVRLGNNTNVTDYAVEYQFEWRVGNTGYCNHGKQELTCYPELADIATVGSPLSGGDGYTSPGMTVTHLGANAFDPANAIQHIEVEFENFNAYAHDKTSPFAPGELLIQAISRGYNHTPIVILSQDDGWSNFMIEETTTGNYSALDMINDVDGTGDQPLKFTINQIGSNLLTATSSAATSFTPAEWNTLTADENVEIVVHTSQSFTVGGEHRVFTFDYVSGSQTYPTSGGDMSISGKDGPVEILHVFDGDGTGTEWDGRVMLREQTSSPVFDVDNNDWEVGDVVTDDESGSLFMLREQRNSINRDYSDVVELQRGIMRLYGDGNVDEVGFSYGVYAQGGYRNGGGTINQAIREGIVDAGLEVDRTTQYWEASTLKALEGHTPSAGWGLEGLSLSGVSIENSDVIDTLAHVTDRYLDKIVKYGGVHWTFIHSLSADSTARSNNQQIAVNDFKTVTDKLKTMVYDEGSVKCLTPATTFPLVTQTIPYNPVTPINARTDEEGVEGRLAATPIPTSPPALTQLNVAINGQTAGKWNATYGLESFTGNARFGQNWNPDGDQRIYCVQDGANWQVVYYDTGLNSWYTATTSTDPSAWVEGQSISDGGVESLTTGTMTQDGEPCPIASDAGVDYTTDAPAPAVDYTDYDLTNTGSSASNGLYTVMTNNISITGSGPFYTITKPAVGQKSYAYDNGSAYRIHAWNTTDSEWVILGTTSDPETLSNGGLIPAAGGVTLVITTSGTDGDGDAIPDPDHPDVTY